MFILNESIYLSRDRQGSANRTGVGLAAVSYNFRSVSHGED